MKRLDDLNTLIETTKETQNYIDLIRYSKQQMFKMCGIPKELFGAEKLKSKRRWWQFWK